MANWQLPGGFFYGAVRLRLSVIEGLVRTIAITSLVLTASVV